MYTVVKNHSIFYQKVGKGPNLILLHGWGNDSSSFWGVVEKLKDDFTIWLIDLPGFGRSDQPQKPFTVNDYAEIIYLFTEKFKIKKPAVLGHSVGGRIAIKLAVKYPETVEKLILESSAGIRPERNFSNPVLKLISKAGNVLIPNIFNLKNKLKNRFYKSIGSDYLTAGELKETFKNIIDEDLTKSISKIKKKTLLIWGDKDPTREASLKNAKKMYRLIPNSKLVVFEGVGHFPHREDPEKFVKYIRDFAK